MAQTSGSHVKFAKEREVFAILASLNVEEDDS